MVHGITGGKLSDQHGFVSKSLLHCNILINRGAASDDQCIYNSPTTSLVSGVHELEKGGFAI